MTAIALQNMLLNKILKSFPNYFDPWAAEWMLSADFKPINLNVHLHQSFGVITCIVSLAANILKGILFSSISSSLGLYYYLANHVVNRCATHLDFVVRYASTVNRFNII